MRKTIDVFLYAAIIICSVSLFELTKAQDKPNGGPTTDHDQTASVDPAKPKIIQIPETDSLEFRNLGLQAELLQSKAENLLRQARDAQEAAGAKYKAIVEANKVDLKLYSPRITPDGKLQFELIEKAPPEK